VIKIGVGGLKGHWCKLGQICGSDRSRSWIEVDANASASENRYAEVIGSREK
jgi:hypothetical protein